MRNAIMGTVRLVGVASLVGIPIGILAGVYLSEYEAGSWLAAPGALLRRRAGGRAEHRHRRAWVRTARRSRRQ